MKTIFPYQVSSEQLGAALEQLMKAGAVSFSELEKAHGMHYKTVKSYLLGKTNPFLTTSAS